MNKIFARIIIYSEKEDIKRKSQVIHTCGIISTATHIQIQIVTSVARAVIHD